MVALGLVTATLAIRNANLRYDIRQLNTINRVLILNTVRQDPIFSLFNARFPEATSSFDSGAANWSQIVETDGTSFVYACRFDMRSGVSLVRGRVVSRKDRIYDDPRDLSLEEFAAATQGPTPPPAGPPTADAPASPAKPSA